MSQAGGEARALGLGERGEPEATPDHEVRLAPEFELPPDHGAPDHLGREAQRPARRREIDGARRAEAEEVKVFDLRARGADVGEADLPNATHPCGRPVDQLYARRSSPLLSLAHHSLTSIFENTVPQ